jgi:hypothetical protein
MPITWGSNSMYRHMVTSRQGATSGRYRFSAILAGFTALFLAITSATAGASSSGYPLAAYVSQGTAEVEMGYNSECVGGAGTTVSGESVCFPVAIVGGVDVHPMHMLTPGKVEIRLSRAGRIVEARDGDITGAVTQVDPSNATIRFTRALPGGSLGTIEVEYEGAHYVFVFKPLNAVSVTRMTCNAYRAVIGINASVSGHLRISVNTTEEGVIGRAIREGKPGRRIIDLQLKPSRLGRSRRSCLVHVSLSNKWGRERVSFHAS